MKVLHLFSDWKWTGPAEPTVSLCEALAREGIDVTIAYRKTPIEFPERTVEKEVKRRSIPFYEGFRLNRYFSMKDWLFDIRSIKEYVLRNKVDILHANLSHDHLTALFSVGFSNRRPLLIRTDHKRDGMPAGRFVKWTLDRTDGVATYSNRIREQDVTNFSFPMERTCVISPGVVPYAGPLRNMRQELGLKEEDKVVGIIGRLKPDRGYDVVLKAFALVKERVGNAKLLIMGRSSQIEKSIMEPLAQLGLTNDVVLAGYRIDDYFSVIDTFDLFVMMRAGSDGTARALREVMAMGKPAIVSTLGMLPELVDDEATGFVVDPDPAALAEKMALLIGDDGKRSLFGAEARNQAGRKWNFQTQAREMIRFYETLLKLGRR